MNNFFKNVLQDIKDISIPLYKILIPFVFILKILEVSGLIEIIARILEPFMVLVGLEPELGLVFVTGLFVNIYAAIVVFANTVPSLDLNVAQITVLATMILIAHGIPVESTISKATGVGFTYTICLRLISAFVLGYILNQIYSSFDIHQQQFSTFIDLQPPPSEVIPWFINQFINLIYIFFIVCLLVTSLEILKLVGIEKLFLKVFTVPLKFFGIQKEAMNIIIVGMTLGIQFGGGLLIKEVKSGKIDKQSAFLSVSMLNLIHAMIEDTLLMLMIGAHISGVFFARLIFGFILCYFIFKIYVKFQTKLSKSL